MSFQSTDKNRIEMESSNEVGIVNPAFDSFDPELDDLEENSIPSMTITSINLDSDYDHRITMTNSLQRALKGQPIKNSTVHDSEMSSQNNNVSKKSMEAWKEPQVKDAKDVGGNRDRESWDRPIEFLLSCISMSVGLGNVWRFPFTAYDNGGGVFLIVYLIVLTIIGRPIYFLELVIGQFSSSGPIRVWKMVPILRGVGFGQMIGAACVVSFYVSIMALTVFYFFASIQTQLPWSVCDPSWAGMCNENNTASLAHPNSSLSQLYFRNEVLKQRETIDEGLGYPEWRLTLCLLFSWILIFFVLFKGVKSSGKTAYFTSLFPYFVIITLLIRGVTLEGAWNGIYYFVVPQWDKLYDIQIWYAAVGQCFLSLGVGFGIVTMLSSYNNFERNVYKDAMIISIADTITSFLAGVTIFSILGNLAHELDTDISKVVDAGPGLAFESLPYAIAQFTWFPQVFSLLFFFMMITIALGSAVALTNAIVTVLADAFPTCTRWLLVGGICIAGFLVGLIYVTPGGQFMVTLVDFYGVSFLLYLMAVLQVMGVAWFYGMANISRDVEFMLKFKLSLYWKLCWKFVCPLSLTAILIYSLITAETLKHNGKEFPEIALICGRIMAGISLVPIPICAIHTIMTRKSKGLLEKIKESFKPTFEWGPMRDTDRNDWINFKSKVA